MKKLFSSYELFKEGLGFFTKNWEKLSLVAIIAFLISAAFQVVVYAIEFPFISNKHVGRVLEEMPLTYSLAVILITLFGYIVSILLTYNTQKIYLNIVNGKHFEVKDMFKGFRKNVFWWVLASGVYGLYIFVPVTVIFFAISSVIMTNASPFVMSATILLSAALVTTMSFLLCKYVFVPLLVLDKEMGVLAAFRQSAKMTEISKGIIFNYYVFIVLAGLLFIGVGLLCFIVGVVPAAIIFSSSSQISGVLLYRKFSI